MTHEGSNNSEAQKRYLAIQRMFTQQESPRSLWMIEATTGPVMQNAISTRLGSFLDSSAIHLSVARGDVYRY
jgi:hypothetical protein